MQPPPPSHSGPPTLALRSDEWGHQACQLPRRWAGCPRRAARPPSQGEEVEQSREGQGRAGMPELTLGKAWMERTSGNMEKHREGRWSRGVQDAHANRGPAWAPATQWAVWIHTQHVVRSRCLLRTFHFSWQQLFHIIGSNSLGNTRKIRENKMETVQFSTFAFVKCVLHEWGRNVNLFCDGN